MAATVDDIIVTKSEWVDVYTKTGITVGADVSISNKGTSYLLYQEKDNQPASDDSNGQLIGRLYQGDYQGIVQNATTKIWLRALGDGKYPVNVQEI